MLSTKHDPPAFNNGWMKWKKIQSRKLREVLYKPECTSNIRNMQVGTYWVRFSKNCCVLIVWVNHWWRFNLAARLFLIPSLVEDYCESLCGSRVIDIPFSKLWQWFTLFLWKFKFHKICMINAYVQLLAAYILIQRKTKIWMKYRRMVLHMC